MLNIHTLMWIQFPCVWYLRKENKFPECDSWYTVTVIYPLSKIKASVFKIYWNFLLTTASSVQSLSRVRLFSAPWIAALQASLSITNSRTSPKLMCILSVMPSSHLILCCPLLLLTPIPSSIRIFSNESTLHMRWPKYWSFSLSISPSNKTPRTGR